MTQKYYRQGDILFEKVDSFNENGQQLDTKTVAKGEKTGHHHSFREQDQVLLYGTQEPEMVVVESEVAQITHQEHKPIELEKGIYKVTREQGYNPFLQRLQRSVD